MTWTDFVDEFNKKFFNPTALSVHQIEFLNFKQDNMTIVETKISIDPCQLLRIILPLLSF